MRKVAFFRGVLLISPDAVSSTTGSKMTVGIAASLAVSGSRLRNAVITVATVANFSAPGKVVGLVCAQQEPKQSFNLPSLPSVLFCSAGLSSPGVCVCRCIFQSEC
jgi:hypothetical protein